MALAYLYGDSNIIGVVGFVGNIGIVVVEKLGMQIFEVGDNLVGCYIWGMESVELERDKNLKCKGCICLDK